MLVVRRKRIPHPLTHHYSVSFSRRRLPRIHPPGKWLFVTWHLEGSLPQALFPALRKHSDAISTAFEPDRRICIVNSADQYQWSREERRDGSPRRRHRVSLPRLK